MTLQIVACRFCLVIHNVLLICKQLHPRIKLQKFENLITAAIHCPLEQGKFVFWKSARAGVPVEHAFHFAAFCAESKSAGGKLVWMLGFCRCEEMDFPQSREWGGQIRPDYLQKCFEESRGEGAWRSIHHATNQLPAVTHKWQFASNWWWKWRMKKEIRHTTNIAANQLVPMH